MGWSKSDCSELGLERREIERWCSSARREGRGSPRRITSRLEYHRWETLHHLTHQPYDVPVTHLANSAIHHLPQCRCHPHFGYTLPAPPSATATSASVHCRRRSATPSIRRSFPHSLLLLPPFLPLFYLLLRRKRVSSPFPGLVIRRSRLLRSQRGPVRSNTRWEGHRQREVRAELKVSTA